MDTFATRYAYKKGVLSSTPEKSNKSPKKKQQEEAIVHADEFADESPTQTMINKRLRKSATKRMRGKSIKGGRPRKRRTLCAKFRNG